MLQGPNLPFDPWSVRIAFAAGGIVLGSTLTFILARWRDKLTSKDRHRKVAKTLIVETLRMSAMLGPSPTTRLEAVMASTRPLPSTQPRLDPVVAEAAQIDPYLGIAWAAVEQWLNRLADARSALDAVIGLQYRNQLLSELRLDENRQYPPQLAAPLAECLAAHAGAEAGLEAIRRHLVRYDPLPLWKRLPFSRKDRVAEAIARAEREVRLK